ncbi:CLUMA_CG021383, isoform A [Clunio marinus]|uniref:CLUMA_CG021383, isoform A n=1 Tax=Clunio marinus TaxID=568069 RepID=A0A1J1J7F6_9DIPT|nr:CLUMA_CG021383, isoform A [Clunio marinus]
MIGTVSTVMVKPKQQEMFERFLNEKQMRYRILIDDLEKSFELERQAQLENIRTDSLITFDRYYQHSEINKYLDYLQEELFNHSAIIVETVGKSFEGRDIKIITITNGDGRKKNSIFIDAGIHAREWISPATALYLINQLVDPTTDYSRLLNELDFTIMPVVNPDGYQYTHDKNRLWRKTRSLNSGPCYGTDGNRNFDYHWGEVGASDQSCSEIYRGVEAFSEVETQLLRSAVRDLRESCKFYLTLHSYGNLLLYPWGWTSDLPETWRDIDDIARIGAEAIQNSTGTTYTVGSSTNILYAAAGGSDDYMFAVENIPISITMELPGGGAFGFDPPPNSILRIVKESAYKTRSSFHGRFYSLNICCRIIMKTLLVLCFVVVFINLSFGFENLKNFKVYDVTSNSKNIDGLLEWRDAEGVDFWRAGAAGTVSRIAVQPLLQDAFEMFLKSEQFDYEVYIEDVGELEHIFEEDKVRRLSRKTSAIEPLSSPDFGVFWTSDEMDLFCRRLAIEYPQFVEREVIARSFEGRDVFALKFSIGGFGRKPLMFIDGGMHAREWVSQATLMYFIHRMVEDPVTRVEMLGEADWIIIPNLNPDGYTWSYTSSRLWRQNRHRINSTCVGVDLNRNFRYSWRAPNPNTCGGLTFPGLTPLSEIESLALNNYMTQHRANVRLYMSVHSFGDMVLYPWGFSGSSGWISNWEEHHQVGLLWANAIREQTGKVYRVGNIADILGNAFGASDDHMAGEQRVNLVYTLELTGGGITGFDFPESRLGDLVIESPSCCLDFDENCNKNFTMKLVILFSIFSFVLAKDYTNYKVYDVTPNREQIKDLKAWEFQMGIDFWMSRGVDQTSRIMVSPEVEESFVNFLNKEGIDNKLIIEDVQSSLDRDANLIRHSRSKRSAFQANGEPDFTLFLSYEEMESFTISLAQQYPNLVKRDVIGRSIEGRDIFGMRVSSGTEFGKKPIIFIDAGIHAREWVGPHVVLYLLNQLVTNATVTSELLDRVDWVIVPNANPDGYVYSQSEDRLWRKNRRYVNYTCTGIDLNRNFGYVWRYSANSCPTIGYPGPHALSEPETVALTSYMESFKFNLRLYLSTHSYGDYVLWPFGFASNVYIKNWREHDEVGKLWANAIRAATGKEYRVGNSADILYTANGASDDHAVAHANANLAYTLELTGGGSAGFDFPQDKVYDLAVETFLGYRQFGFKNFLKKIKQKMILKIFFIWCFNFFLFTSALKDYTNYKIYDVTPERDHVDELVKWEYKADIDFLTKKGSGKPWRIMVSPHIEDSFLDFLSSNEIQHKLILDNVESSIQEERNLRKRSKRNVLSDGIRNPNFELYWSFEEMETYTLTLAQLHPNLVKREIIGKSIEGRDIIGLRISSALEFGKNPIIFIDAGTHSREWVGPHTVLYFIDQLVTNATVRDELLEKVDWVFIPNVNPDGYVYTQTEDRFWRKNRRLVNYTCTGVDLNRNYEYAWRQVPNSCSTLNYPGSHPLSEPETFAVANYMKTFKYNLKLYLSVHSAGPQVLWPFGFDFGVYVMNWKEHDYLGHLWADEVYLATETLFEVGNSADILYTSNGASDDYALAYADAKLAYTIELPPSEYNHHDYPQDMVFDLVKGIFYGYRAMGLYIGENYN